VRSKRPSTFDKWICPGASSMSEQYERSGNMGRLWSAICFKPLVTPGMLNRHRRLEHGLPDA
jgi:hypothetical protein